MDCCAIAAVEAESFEPGRCLLWWSELCQKEMGVTGCSRTMALRPCVEGAGPSSGGLGRVFGCLFVSSSTSSKIKLFYVFQPLSEADLFFLYSKSSLTSITSRTWITPIKNSTLHNTRSGLGGFADRVGALAFALTPFAILLSSRESILSSVTGIASQHFVFLHRWTGRIIFAQSFLHTLGWTIIEGRFCQPQRSNYAEFLNQRYMIFGVVAMALISGLVVFSTQTAIRSMGYGVFKVVHWVLAVLYVGACWGH
jgi:hypothetical protein